ncbi:MAG TPA: FG-GAP-like repeat-containing protein [Bryobacteraceae bacterium]|nr:FG-GAP-like repeat-containing protein [Bryobacteraceae bacterium]
MKRLTTRLLIALSASALVLIFVFAQTAASIVPFATSRSLAAFSFSSGVTLEVRAPDMSYTQLQFGVSGVHTMLSSMESLLKIISGSVPFSTNTPAGPPNVGLSSQAVAVADFTGDNSPGVAYVDVAAGRPVVTVYQGTPSFLFRGSTAYDVGVGPAEVLAADFNRDGKPDLAVTFVGDNSPGGLAILLNKGDGTFGQAVTYSAGLGPTSIAAFDLNHDGILDLAVPAAGANPGVVYVFLGKSDGTFAQGVTYATDRNPEAVTIADCNGDGNADLAISTGNNTVSILLGNGNGTFRAPTSYPTGRLPFYIAAGDLNNDGKIDLVTANTLDQTISVLLGKGDGSFQLRSSYVTSYHPASLVLTDFNQDGKLDVIQALGDARGFGPAYDSENIDFLMGNGDGTLQGAQAYTTVSNAATFLATADFNGDGKLDALVNDEYLGGLYLFNGAGNGAFQPSTLITTLTAANGNQAGIYAAAVGDFNGDGKPDVAVSENFAGGVAILLDSASGLQPSFNFPSGGAAAAGIATADFNGDGKLDLAVANPPNSTIGAGSANVAVFFGGGNGSFQMNKTYPAGGQPGSVAVADLNGDGKPDLVVADQGIRAATNTPGGLYVYLNNGSGGFQTASQYPVSNLPIFVTVGDVNGDGKPDLVAASDDGNFNYYVGVLLNNGNGTFQAAKLMKTDFGPASIAVSDFNGDGKVDLVVAHCCGDTDMTYLQGNGDGTFQPEVHFNAGASPNNITVADLNGDSKPDLLVGQTSGLSALLNNAQAGTSATTANWATGAQVVAPNSIASVYGTHLATGTTASGAAPQTLGGTSVTVTDSAGVSQAAALYYASAVQLNIVIPPGLVSGAATVSVKSGDGVTSTGTVQVAEVAPGILTAGTTLLNAYAVQYDAQGNQTGQVQTVQVDSSGKLVATPISLDVGSGSVYLLVFGTGIRGAPQSQVSVQVGSMKLAPAFSGAQGQFPGLDQINVQLPASLKGSGDVTLSVTAAGQNSNTAHLTIQ